MDSEAGKVSKNNGILAIIDGDMTHQLNTPDASPLAKYLPKSPKNEKTKKSKVITK